MNIKNITLTALLLLIAWVVVMFDISVLTGIYESTGVLMTLIVTAVLISIEIAALFLTVMGATMAKMFIQDKIKT